MRSYELRAFCSCLLPIKVASREMTCNVEDVQHSKIERNNLRKGHFKISRSICLLIAYLMSRLQNYRIRLGTDSVSSMLWNNSRNESGPSMIKSWTFLQMKLQITLKFDLCSLAVYSRKTFIISIRFLRNFVIKIHFEGWDLQNVSDKNLSRVELDDIFMFETYLCSSLTEWAWATPKSHFFLQRESSWFPISSLNSEHFDFSFVSFQSSSLWSIWTVERCWEILPFFLHSFSQKAFFFAIENDVLFSSRRDPLDRETRRELPLKFPTFCWTAICVVRGRSRPLGLFLRRTEMGLFAGTFDEAAGASVKVASFFGLSRIVKSSAWISSKVFLLCLH